MAKSIRAIRDLPAGQVLSWNDIALKSPGDGLPPYEVDRMLGKKLVKPLAEDDLIQFDNIA